MHRHSRDWKDEGLQVSQASKVEAILANQVVRVGRELPAHDTTRSRVTLVAI